MIKLTLAESERFWAKVDKTESCWLWTASTRGGYGAFKLRGSLFDAHRLVWLIIYGPLEPGYEVCHTVECSNRLCVNPSHLYAGTRSDNVLDSVTTGTHGARQQRKLSAEVVEQIRYLNSNGIGHRRLAKIFGVTRTNIQRLVQGKTYKEI